MQSGPIGKAEFLIGADVNQPDEANQPQTTDLNKKHADNLSPNIVSATDCVKSPVTQTIETDVKRWSK